MMPWGALIARMAAAVKQETNEEDIEDKDWTDWDLYVDDDNEDTDDDEL